MNDPSPKDERAAQDAYNPADEYTPLEAPFDTSAEPQQPAEDAVTAAAQAPAGAPVSGPFPAQPVPAQPAQPAPAQPPQGYCYPGAPYYPYYSAPYIQPPAQPPYYPGYPQPGQAYDPRQGAVPPYPSAPVYYYPPQQMPPAPIAPIPVPPQTKPEPADKPATSTGTKVFLIVLTALLLAMIAAFIIYIVNLSNDDKKNANSLIEDINSSPTLPVPDDGGSIDPFQSPDSINATEFEEEITLVEDKGETQQRDDDIEDSVGAPDPKAKGVELLPLPKDKDDAKYTTQNAYETVCDAVVTVELYENKISENAADIIGQGTGTIISSDGYLITNAHVIQNSKHYAVKIVTNSGKSYQAKIIGYDTWTDIALLKIDAEGLTAAVFGDSDLIEIGQDVIAIGSPGGNKFKNSLTKGVVSAIGREISVNKYVRYIQSDAAISPGNSGGPLCNIYGQVIGINTAKTIATNYESMTFSIPSADVQEVVNELLHYGYRRGRTRIGFTGYEVSAEEQMYGIPAGLIVVSVDDTGSLKDADIKENDIITAIDGEPVASFQDIYVILSKHKPGDKLTLSVYREED